MRTRKLPMAGGIVVNELSRRTNSVKFGKVKTQPGISVRPMRLRLSPVSSVLNPKPFPNSTWLAPSIVKLWRRDCAISGGTVVISKVHENDLHITLSE